MERLENDIIEGEEVEDDNDELEDDGDDLSESLFPHFLESRQWDQVVQLAQSNDGPRQAKRLVFNGDLSGLTLPLMLALTLNAPFVAVEAIVNAYPRAVIEPGPSSFPIHVAAIYHSDINVMKLLLNADPVNGAKREDRFSGSLPLHDLLLYNESTTVDMVKLFLEANTNGIMLQRKIDGWFPLHSACAYVVVGYNNEIMKILLQAYPRAAQQVDKHQRLPFHYAVGKYFSIDTLQRLFEAYPNGIRHADKWGRLPIHYAVMDDSSADEVKFIIEAYPEGLLTKSGDGFLPIHELCRLNLKYQKPENVVKIMKVLLLSAPESVVVTAKDPEVNRSLSNQQKNQKSSEEKEREMQYYPKELAKHYGMPKEVISLLEQYEQLSFISIARDVVGRKHKDILTCT